MKYDRLLVDDESIGLMIRKQKASSSSEAAPLISQVTFLMKLSRRFDADVRIVAFGFMPSAVGASEDDDFYDLLRRQELARKSMTFKAKIYPLFLPAWEVMQVEEVSSARIVATLAENCAGEGRTLIVTADERLLAYVGKDTEVLVQGVAKNCERLWTLSSFRSSYGFTPKLYPVYRTLTCVDSCGRSFYMDRDSAKTLLQTYPNILDLVNAYICHSLILNDDLRPRIRSLSAHLKENVEGSIVRTCPKAIELWQALNTKIKWDENDGDR